MTAWCVTAGKEYRGSNGSLYSRRIALSVSRAAHGLSQQESSPGARSCADVYVMLPARSIACAESGAAEVRFTPNWIEPPETGGVNWTRSPSEKSC